MIDKTFEMRLNLSQTKEEIAQLAYDLIEDSVTHHSEDKIDSEICEFPEKIQKLVDKGLDPNIIIDEASCIFDLQYGFSDYHLQAAKIIFENCGLPTFEDEDGFTFFNSIRSKIDYDYYNSEFLVKLYLLCCAYTEEETYLSMEENLYKEMFDNSCEYISARDGKTPFKITPKAFKDIEKYDYCIEMTEQIDGCYGCWKLIVFDKKTKIKVATYC